jgi:hypothetical protein
VSNAYSSWAGLMPGAWGRSWGVAWGNAWGVLEPRLSLTPNPLTILAQFGGDPVSRFVPIVNAGGGTFDGPSIGSPGYGPAEPTGWLTAELEGSGIRLTVDLTGLDEGAYHASVEVSDALATNSPQTLEITLVALPPPSELLVLTPNPLTILAQFGGDPVSRFVLIGNAGAGTLYGPQIGAPEYGVAEPSGWLTAELEGSGIRLTVDLTGLAMGTYHANVEVSDALATNSPQTLALTLKVGPPKAAEPIDLDNAVGRRGFGVGLLH